MSKEQVMYGNVPSINRDRTTHTYKKRTQTTGNVGEIIPFYVNELVLPGDTFKIDLSAFCRMTVAKYPSMDDLYLDIYFFKQNKNNLVNEYSQFMGENLTGMFEQKTDYQMPKIAFTGQHTSARSLYNRLYGLKFGNFTNVSYISALPMLMYWQTWNDWFRDQNYMPPQVIPSANQYSSGTARYLNKMNLNSEITTRLLSQIPTDPYYVGEITNTAPDGTAGESLNYSFECMAKACKFHDYFTTIIPEVQKGDPTQLPIAGTVKGSVMGNGKTITLTNGTEEFGIATGLTQGAGASNIPALGQGWQGMNVGNTVTTPGNLTAAKTIGLTTNANLSGMETEINLANAIVGTINDMRTILAQQHYLENAAIFGTREKEILRSRYGIISNATTTHTVEYLGGKRIPLNMDTVLQTSSSDGESPQGNAAGYSVTADTDEMFTKSFDYDAVIMGVAVVRQGHTYSQGLNIQHQKFKPFDFWTPEFNNIGCQPIYDSEIFLTTSGNTNMKTVFGYKMAWQEYRQEINQVTGMLSPTYSNPLDEWNYADFYENTPVASMEWLLETPKYVDRTLTVTSQVTDQLIFDFVLDVTKVSEVSKFSIPGLDKF